MLVHNEWGCGMGSICVTTYSDIAGTRLEGRTHEAVSFACMTTRMMGDDHPRVTMPSPVKVEDLKSWAFFPTDDDVSVQEADRRIAKLEEALIGARDALATAATYGSSDMVVSIIGTVADNLNDTLKERA